VKTLSLDLAPSLRFGRDFPAPNHCSLNISKCVNCQLDSVISKVGFVKTLARMQRLGARSVRCLNEVGMDMVHIRVSCPQRSLASHLVVPSDIQLSTAKTVILHRGNCPTGFIDRVTCIPCRNEEKMAS
jgi:hypothetical protein